MNNPTNINAGAVAAPGTAINNGENINANAKRHAVVNDVRPVLPPSATPARAVQWLANALVNKILQLYLLHLQKELVLLLEVFHPYQAF